MPSRTPRICTRCQQPVTTGHDCRPTADRRSQSSTITGTRRWKKARRDQLRKHPFCQHSDAKCDECGGTCDRIAEEVDHIVPIAQGGPPWDRSNFQSLCEPCHQVKTAADRANANT